MTTTGKNRYAAVRWQDGAPVSEQFDDVYFSREDGLAETDHVFLQSNQLRERFAALPDAGGNFTIGELGFGSGLNFLACAALFLETAPPTAALHYFSCEKYPLRKSDLARALAAYPALAPLTAALLEAYPPPAPGVYPLLCASPRIQLTLGVGDALEVYSGLVAPEYTGFDAWFLDGFAPAKNPQMWRPAIFRELARLSQSGTTFGTFTAAAQVRRDLEAVGFQVKKNPGYGRKREMLCGAFQSITSAAPRARATPPVQRDALVIGAGVAGAALAFSLARRGYAVQVLERAPAAAAGASGAAAGIAMPLLTAEPAERSALLMAGLVQLQSRLACLAASGAQVAHRRGAFMTTRDPELLERYARGLISHELPSDWAQALGPTETRAALGVEVSERGVFFPDALTLAPREYVAALLASHAGIQTRYNCAVAELERGADGWEARDADGNALARARVAVCANAADAARFNVLAHLPLRRVRGQLFRLPANNASRALAAALSYDGYITPELDGEHIVGATFEQENPNPENEPQQNDALFAALRDMAPELARSFEPLDLQSQPTRTAFRAAAPDHLPLIGAAPDVARVRAAYPQLMRSIRGRRVELSDLDPDLRLPDFYVSVAFGSYGLISSAWAAEVIAAQINGETPPARAATLAAVDPARFCLRALRRGE